MCSYNIAANRAPRPRTAPEALTILATAAPLEEVELELSVADEPWEFVAVPLWPEEPESEPEPELPEPELPEPELPEPEPELPEAVAVASAPETLTPVGMAPE